MAKYDITFSCGHTGTVNLIGKMKDREWKLARLSDNLCDDCWEIEKQRRFDEKNARATQEAAEMDLPGLTGSEKQVSWANTLRSKWIEVVEKQIEQAKKNLETIKAERPEEAAKAEELFNALEAAVERILLKKTDSRYWIDTRSDNVSRIIIEEAEKIQAEQALPPVPKAVEQAAIEDMTMRAAQPVTPLVTEIRIKDNFVLVRLDEKNETFRKIVKSLRFTWTDGCWQRKTAETTGSAMERATELGIKLLAGGFSIRVYSDALQRAILAGDCTPECHRWIMIYKDRFRIWWSREEGDFYREAKRLPGSRWVSEKSSMGVPTEAFRELQDFAAQYQFRFTEKAQARLKEARQVFEAAMVADVTVPQKEQLPQPGRPPQLVPPQEESIDESLRDEN